eukprot:CAMPEP_0175387916 /NCGR_PEP_ID=MMETSP0095-20121207/30114_1 /TAXON_ID=311494 /ORGANISM="Alexandrium monilatum, Strain CCMP3105" /LENGTH=71 /DNA_ID=CAMNT_0016686399 /DNA_START=69 /DNA_END=280 /DNA_ORIENTATION=-
MAWLSCWSLIREVRTSMAAILGPRTTRRLPRAPRPAATAASSYARSRVRAAVPPGAARPGARCVGLEQGAR